MTGGEDHAHAPVCDRRPHPPARARAAQVCAAPHAVPAVPPTARLSQAPRRVGAYRDRPGPRRPRLRRCLAPTPERVRKESPPYALRNCPSPSASHLAGGVSKKRRLDDLGDGRRERAAMTVRSVRENRTPPTEKRM